MVVHAAAKRRIVLLGASNLVRALPTVTDLARASGKVPLEIMAAVGHGRSFGLPSQVLGRTLPGIRGCGLWQGLQERPSLPTVAVITDVGNDILYDVPNETIAAWVTSCVDDLSTQSAQALLVGLPLVALEQLGELRFTLLRTCLFPRARISLREALARARDLNARLEALARTRNVTLIHPPGEWYGLDPIHIRGRWIARAWQEILSELSATATLGVPRIRFWTRIRWYAYLPHERQIMGVTQRREQPCAMFRDGTTLSLY